MNGTMNRFLPRRCMGVTRQAVLGSHAAGLGPAQSGASKPPELLQGSKSAVEVLLCSNLLADLQAPSPLEAACNDRK